MSSPKARPWLSNTDRLAALGDWVHAYDTRQAHSAIGGYPPIARLVLQRQLICPVVAHRGADSGSRGPVAGVRVAMSTNA